MNFFATAIEGLIGLGAATTAYGLTEAQMFVTRDITVAAIPPSAGGPDAQLRILHLSDLHITPNQTRKINWVRGLAELEPDLVVATGDFLAHQLAVPAVAEALGELLNRPGMFVLGSNDYFAPQMKNPFTYFNKNRVIDPSGRALPTQDLVDVLTDAGWVDLNNKQQQVSVNGVSIHARGTDDPHINLDRYEDVEGPFTSERFALGVTHAPYKRVLDSFAKDDSDLILAGHTHGGQVCIPFYGALVTNCDLPTGQAKGLSTHQFAQHSCPMHVSAGVGTSPITPVRIACRPEATLLTVTTK